VTLTPHYLLVLWS